MPPCWKPRKIPTTCARGKSWISAILSSLFRTARQGRGEIRCLPAGSHEGSLRPVLWVRVGLLPYCPPLSVPTLRRIGVLQLKRIQCGRVAAETRTHTLVDEVLQNIEVEIDQRRIFMRLLQAAWVMGNWKTVDRIRKH